MNLSALPIKKAILGLCLFILAAADCAFAQEAALTGKEIGVIAQKVFHNECGGNAEDIVCWNEGEYFLSLGIGHFIWYPEGKDKRFDESFPRMIDFIVKRGAQPPQWVKGSSCPWSTRKEFMRDFHGPKAESLRKFLVKTKKLQALYLADRINKALPKMLKASGKESRANVRRQFYRMENSPGGMYALIDYVNFKGEGILLSERYKGEGWGVLQVLENMRGEARGVPAVREFAAVARYLLADRIKNDPLGYTKKRWLPVWERRLDTYVKEAIDSRGGMIL